MSNYTKVTDFASKDALLTGNPSKLVKGTEINVEFAAIETAVATKADASSANAFVAGATTVTTLTTSGHVIFPAVQNPSANVNTLDDYEEGTWTPTQGAGLTVVGGFSSTGTYTKIGRQVTVHGRVSGATSVAVTAGGAVCAGLPFAVAGDPYAVGSMTNNSTNVSVISWVVASTIYAGSAITATTNIFFTITYFF